MTIYQHYSELKKSDTGDKGGSIKTKSRVDRLIRVLSAVFYAGFIIMDNISVLTHLNFLPRASETSALTWANSFWLASLILSIVYMSIKLIKLSIKEEYLTRRDLSEKAMEK